MAECEDDMNPELREQLDAFFDEQSLVDEVNAATLAATNPTDLEEFTSEDDTALDEEDSDVPLSFFVEPHKLHCSPDAEPGATHICDSSELYEAVFGEAVDPTRFALTIEHLQADDKNDVEWISHDLSQARLGLLRSLAVQVPLCDFTALVKALDTIQELGDFVSTVIALSQLAEVDAEAVINISERLPSDLWLFYTKWFLVVERICGQIPWFGDTRGLSFWMELDAACPTGQAQTELLNVFEALLDKEEKEMENHKSSDEEDTDSELEDGETQNSSGTQSDDASELSSTSTDNLSFNIDERVPYYSLEEFANYLNIFSGWVGIPNSIRDLPRLSRQERWWCRINSRCPGLFTPLLPDLRFAVEQFLYYVEYLESECGDMGGYAEKFIDQLVDDLVKSAVDPKAALSRVNELVQNLREVLMLPFRSKSELRRHLAELSSLTYRAEHPKDFLGDVENRTVQEVVDFLSDSSSFDENTLLSIQVAVEQVITSRNHPRRVMDDDSSTAFTLVQLDEVVFQVYGFYLYPVQLVAIVCATSASTSGADIEIAASILQMETGEGKSVTFAVIAAYYASRKMTVDIATSSDQLAIDGAADAEALFRKLGLSVGVTSHSVLPHRTLKRGYGVQIVYSTISQLAGDHLRSLIFGDGGRPFSPNPRKFDVLLLDEVDAALIDGVANMTMLSMQVAGMDRLYLMYGALYERTRRTMEIENDRSAMPLATDADLRHQIGLPPLEDTKTEEDVEVLDSEMAGHETVEVEAGNDVSTTTDNDEASDGPLPQMIPKLLKNVVDKKLQVYIDHAWGTQTWMTRGSQYDSESERIVVIDSKTSGEIQPSSVYSEGLHQFLQIHNGCELTPESLNSVFITNGSFVQMYSHVVGITGTIGPKHDQNALVRGLGARNVKFSFLPRSKYRPYTQLPPLVVDDKDMWHSLWMRELKQCIKTGRPVLIIFRDKCVAEEEAKLIEGKLGVQVKRYIINDPKLQSYRPSDLLGPGDIVVSTNFGGRGTDYKLTDTAVKNGGLHTVVTFSASSVRQVGQAFGRSARAGDPGSGVLVAYNGLLQSKDLYSRHEELQDEMQRNYYESLSDQIKHNMYLNRYCDQLFQDFAKVHNKVSSSLHDTQNPVKAVHSCTALRDRFGIFIDELRHDLADRWIHGDKCSDMKWIGEECKARFMDWARGVVTAIKHDKNIITNECSMVVYARDLIEKYPDVKVNRGQLNEALTMTKNAIDSDAFMAGPAAHMLRLKIELKLRRLKSRDEGDHKVVTQLLGNARQAFELELDFVQSISALVCHKRQDTALAKQLQETTNVLLYMHDSVNQALTCCTIEFDKRGQSDDDHYYYEAEFDHLPDDISETTKRIYKENLAVNGHIGLLRLEAKREWSWSWPAFGCIMLGLVQAIGGVALMVFSAGAFGAGLVAEGVADLVTGVIAAIKGDGSFTWGEYFKGKLISLAISLVCTATCKIGKALWSAGKSFAKTALRASKSVWKNGLRTAVKRGWKVAKGTYKTGVENGKAAMKAMRMAAKKSLGGMKRFARTPITLAKASFKQNIVKCGNQVGVHILKSVAISGAGVAIDHGMEAIFDSVEKSIADNVGRSVSAWVDTNEKTLQRLDFMARNYSGHDESMVLSLKDLSGNATQRLLEPSMQSESFVRMFVDGMISEVCSELKRNTQKKSVNKSRNMLLSISLKALLEGAKWTEVIVQVTRFVDAWLDLTVKDAENACEHITCVNTSVLAADMIKGDSGLGFHTSDIDDTCYHCCVSSLSELDCLLQKSDLDMSFRLSAENAKEKCKVMANFEQDPFPDWSVSRRKIESELTDAAATFIRRKLEKRSGEFSKKIGQYGVGKLVGAMADGYLKRKAGRLLAQEPSDLNDAADHEKRIDRFLGDKVASEAVSGGIDNIKNNGAARLAEMHGVARLEGVTFEIVGENGKTQIINPNATGPTIRFNEVGTGKQRHLVPHNIVDGVPFNDTATPENPNCFYSAFLYAKNGQNATDTDIRAIRRAVVNNFQLNRREQLLVYINRKSKRSWGAGTVGATKKPDPHVPSELVVKVQPKDARIDRAQPQSPVNILINMLVARWDLSTGDGSGGDSTTVVSLSHAEIDAINPAIARIANKSKNRDTYCRIDRQQFIKGAQHNYSAYYVQIGNKTYSYVEVPIGPNVGVRRIRKAFHKSHNDNKYVKIDPKRPDQSGARRWRR